MVPAADRASAKVQLATTRAALAKAGIPYAWLDAEILVAHVLRVSRERLHSHPEQRLTQPQRQRLRRLASRRGAPGPGPYPTGEGEVYGNILAGHPPAVLPRPQNGPPAVAALAAVKAAPPGPRVLTLV